jgi:hypothetical protein
VAVGPPLFVNHAALLAGRLLSKRDCDEVEPPSRSPSLFEHDLPAQSLLRLLRMFPLSLVELKANFLFFFTFFEWELGPSGYP